MSDAPRSRATVQIHRDAELDPQVQAVRAKDPMSIVIFGASGDLAQRKLIPALYHLHNAGYLPSTYAVVGNGRTPMSDDEYRERMLEKVQEHVADGTKPGAKHPLIAALHYVTGDTDDAKTFADLREKLEALDAERKMPGNRLFYLSVAPRFFAPILMHLKEAGLIRGKHDPVWTRVIIEKPFGHDLQSARELNDAVTDVLDEDQIYRIDHYLGKETVQNILSFRFGNSIFEPLFNNNHVANVQITVAERLGMEGKRGAYYDRSGAIRDMVQNHMFQLLCLTAMEPPSALDARSIRDEKVKVLKSLIPQTPEEVAANTVRGQYGALNGKSEKLAAYREAEGVDPNSVTESYVALKVKVDNWRWAGVPFYLRTGKCLRKRASEIAITFKRPPLNLFRKESNSDYCLLADRPKYNRLILHIQPDEGMSLSFACKQPGMRVQLEEVDMQFMYEHAFQQRSPEAYERLLLDALRGDASLFTRSDEVDYAWRYITAILDGWKQLPAPKFPNYTPYTDGPEEAQRLMNAGERWRSLESM
ncbi:MAG: glucose-6-phosphate dehydrogenase [Planctomycetes bacterium]|nr:glucose-6-phosphate dehydrogenase [Planctomycetota bacterium]